MPENHKELESVLEMIAYVAKFIPMLSELTAPLRDLDFIYLRHCRFPSTASRRVVLGAGLTPGAVRSRAPLPTDIALLLVVHGLGPRAEVRTGT